MKRIALAAMMLSLAFPSFARNSPSFLGDIVPNYTTPKMAEFEKEARINWALMFSPQLVLFETPKPSSTLTRSLLSESVVLHGNSVSLEPFKCGPWPEMVDCPPLYPTWVFLPWPARQGKSLIGYRK